MRSDAVTRALAASKRHTKNPIHPTTLASDVHIIRHQPEGGKPKIGGSRKMAKKLKKSKKLEATKPLTVAMRGPARG
jgi:hypothetical protein